MIEIDCRKLNCPEPVLRTKKALEESAGRIVKVIVDNDVARDNILRFVKSSGLQAAWQEEGGLFLIQITQEDPLSSPGTEQAEAAACSPSLQQQVILISSDQLGRGSEELGALLMKNFIYTLTKQDRLSRALIFMNSGVKLCVEGSPVLEELRTLQAGGVEVLACGTCLDYFGLKKSLQAGAVSNMYDIIELLLANTVITL